MPNWNKIIVSGSSASLDSLFVRGAATVRGALNATASHAQNSKTASYVSGTFSRGCGVANLTSGFTTTGSYFVWLAPYPCRVTAMYGRANGSATAQINARRSGSGGYSRHTGSNLILSTQNKWIRTNSVTNTDYAAGNSLEIIISGSSAKQVAVQVDFRRL